MTKVYLVRHGQTQWNLEGRLQGAKDSDLTELGIWQAKQVGRRLKDIGFKGVYSSALGRAYHTATLVNSTSIKIQQVETLGEMSFGDWEGRTIHEVQELYPEPFYALFNTAHLYQPVRGETFEELKKRVVKAIDDLAKNHEGETILIVSHAIVIKMILAHVEKRTLESFWDGPFIEGGSISIVKWGNEPQIELYADTSHLTDE